MLGHVANYCPFRSRSTLAKNSNSILSVWNTICEHFDFQFTGAHFSDFANLHLQAEERLEDLFKGLMAFVEDTLLRANRLSHRGEVATEDENFIVLTWLRRIYPDLPRQKQNKKTKIWNWATITNSGFNKSRNISGSHFCTRGNSRHSDECT